MALASNRFKVSVVRESYQLPGTIDEILAQLRSILEGGSVQAIEVCVDEPIRVFRAVDGVEEFEAKNLAAKLRNVELLEYLSEKEGQTRVVSMSALLEMRGLQPVCFVSGGPAKLQEWLKIELGGFSSVRSILGVPIIYSSELDEDVLILCGARNSMSDIDDIEIAVKTDIVVEEGSDERSDKNADRVGPDPKADDRAAGQLEGLAGGGPDGNWVPRGILGGPSA